MEQGRHGLAAVFLLTAGSMCPKCNVSVKKSNKNNLNSCWGCTRRGRAHRKLLVPSHSSNKCKKAHSGELSGWWKDPVLCSMNVWIWKIQERFGGRGDGVTGEPPLNTGAEDYIVSFLLCLPQRVKLQTVHSIYTTQRHNWAQPKKFSSIWVLQGWNGLPPGGWWVFSKAGAAQRLSDQLGPCAGDGSSNWVAGLGDTWSSFHHWQAQPMRVHK